MMKKMINKYNKKIIVVCLSVTIIVGILFGGIVFKELEERNIIKLYRNSLIEEKVESIVTKNIKSKCKVTIDETYKVENVVSMSISCHYSEKDYKNIYKSILEIDGLKTRYDGFAIWLNENRIDTYSCFLEINDNFVWADIRELREILKQPAAYMIGEIIRKNNIVGTAYGYTIKDYCTKNEINVQDVSILDGRNDKEYKYKKGEFVLVVGDVLRNQYVPNAKLTRVSNSIIKQI